VLLPLTLREDLTVSHASSGTVQAMRAVAGSKGFKTEPDGLRDPMRGPSPEVAALAPFAAQWPLQSSLEFGALPGAVPCARLHVRNVLWEWHLTALSDNTELLVSELVTNAIQVSRTAAPDIPIRLWVVSDADQVLVLVWDGCPASPAPTAASAEAESGRGLLLVETLSVRWGWHFPPDMGGKVVWALIAAESQPSPDQHRL